jgi:hypothetical protein
MADDTSGLPDVDLGPVIEGLKAQEKDTKPKETPSEDPADLDLGQFKNPKDLLKSYKEVQGAFTKVTQDNKTYKEKLAALEAEAAALKEQQELARFQPQTNQSQPKSFDEAWMEDPEKALNQKVIEQANLLRIQEILEEEDSKDHASFQERYAYVNMLTQNPQYAHLAATSAGVKKLFQIGDKLRKEQLQKSAGKALESIFGEPLGEEEIAKLRTLVKGDKEKQKTSKTNAYMPDMDTSNATGADADAGPDIDVKMKEAVKKGDVDGVLDAMFSDILAE